MVKKSYPAFPLAVDDTKHRWFRCIEDVDAAHASLSHAAELALKRIAEICETSQRPLSTFAKMRFEKIGSSPLSPDCAMNIIEQLNQSTSHLVALAGVRRLLLEYPNKYFAADSGASASTEHDIISQCGQIAAECFAAVDWRSNNKLKKDIENLRTKRPNSPHNWIFYYDHSQTQYRGETFGIRLERVELELIGSRTN